MGDAFLGGAAPFDAPGGAAGGDLAGTYPSPTVKASVALTGTPTAPTAAAATNTTQLATTAFVTGAGFAAYATAGTWTTKQTFSAISTIALETQQTAANTALRNKLLSADANPAFAVLGSGELDWGPGGATAVDASLRRTAAGVVTYKGIGSSTVFRLEAQNDNTQFLEINVSTGGGQIQTVGPNNGLYIQDSGKKISFYGVAPQLRPAAYTQTYATATRTHSNPTAAAVSTTAATNTTPYGYTTAAQADAIVTAVNALIADEANTKQVLNQVIDDLQSNGLLQ